MPLNNDRMANLLAGIATVQTIEPKRGEEIFEGTNYPHEWAGFIGQEKAKEQLQIQVASAAGRRARCEHTLLASGIAGVGKTTLATLMAYSAGVGLMRTTGPLTAEDARSMMRTMQPRDILFIDEAHRLVEGNRNRADWMLPFMLEGRLYTERGAEPMPDITIVAATTDVGKLPETLIGRFMVQPTITHYSATEAELIAFSLAGRMRVAIPDDAAAPIAQAADHNPRAMEKILTGVRDLAYAYPDTHPNLAKAFEWAGVSYDGLSTTARDMLLVLFMSPEFTASIDSIKAQLGEPGPIKYHEQALLQRGMLTITGRGRKLTDAGLARAQEERVARKENR